MCVCRERVTAGVDMLIHVCVCRERVTAGVDMLIHVCVCVGSVQGHLKTQFSVAGENIF